MPLIRRSLVGSPLLEPRNRRSLIGARLVGAPNRRPLIMFNEMTRTPVWNAVSLTIRVEPLDNFLAGYQCE